MTDHDGRLALKAAALAAADRGWLVFPLRPGGTEPAVRDWQSRATTDLARIERAWSAGPYNVGIIPCASGLLVLDLVAAAPGERPSLQYRLPGVVDGADVLAVRADREQARFPTETFAVATPAGGTMLYFSHPAGPCPSASPGPDSRLGWHVAVRSAGAYVLAVGSITGQGPYRLIHDAPPAPWPGWLSRLVGDATPLSSCVS